MTLRPEQLAITRDFRKTAPVVPTQFNPQRAKLSELSRRYLKKSTLDSVADLDKLCSYWSLENEPKPWTHETRRKAVSEARSRPLPKGAKSISELTVVEVTEWMMQSFECLQVGVEAVFSEFWQNCGIAFGDLMCKEFRLEWGIVEDARLGRTAIAVQSETLGLAVIPYVLVTPERICSVPDVWHHAREVVEAEIYIPLEVVLPHRALQVLENEANEVISEMDSVIATLRRAFEALSLNPRAAEILRSRSQEEWTRVMNDFKGIQCEFGLLQRLLEIVMGDVQEWKEIVPEQVVADGRQLKW